jgi:hypothetical protein
MGTGPLMRPYAVIAAEENPPAIVEFWDRPVPRGDRLSDFDVEDYYCLDPRCDCQAVMLCVAEAGGGQRGGLYLPFDEGKEPVVDLALGDEGDALMQAVLDLCGARFWKEARHRYQEAQEYGRQHPESHIQIERGKCLPYLEFAPHAGKLMRFTYNGQPFIAIDMYCPDPGCDCEAMLFDVQRLHEVKPDELDWRPFTTIRYDLRRSRPYAATGKPVTSRDRKILAALFKDHPGLAAQLRPRYQAAKEFGRKLEQAGGFIDPQPEPKVWRLR